MTKPADGVVQRVRCAWCGRGFEPEAGRGRPRRYCRRSCRQRAYEARRRGAELGLADDELVVTRIELDELRDRLWVLQCAVEDVERDLGSARTVQDHREALDWLLEHARPLLERP